MREPRFNRQAHALALIEEGAEDVAKAVSHGDFVDSFVKGIGFGKMGAAYWHLLSHTERLTVLGLPSEWHSWLIDGITQSTEIRAQYKGQS
jgi:hypothetical protein